MQENPTTDSTTKSSVMRNRIRILPACPPPDYNTRGRIRIPPSYEPARRSSTLIQSVLARTADRLVLRPSRQPIDCNGKQRRLIDCACGTIEVWTQSVGCCDPDQADVMVLKYVGMAGRAERANTTPLEYWPDLRGQVWAVNFPGYGGSSGQASLANVAEVARASYRAIADAAPGRPVFVVGNSLGTLSALLVAARFPTAGLILRNPLPLRELIVGRHGWWNLWLGAALIAGQVPAELCSIRNARSCQAPAVFISSQRDRVVPRSFQQKVIRGYAGPRRVVRLGDADHASPLTSHQHVALARRLAWLRGQALGQPVVPAASG